jgi:hypothetical protein
MVKRRYDGLDLIAAVHEASVALNRYVQFFAQVKHKPSLIKGILRINL